MVMICPARPSIQGGAFFYEMPAMLPRMGRASPPTDATGAGGGVVVVSLGGTQERKMRVQSGQGRTPAGTIILSSSFVAFGIKSWMIILLPVDRSANINQYTHTQLFLHMKSHSWYVPQPLSLETILFCLEATAASWTQEMNDPFSFSIN